MKNYLSGEFFDSMKQFLRKMRTTCIILIVFTSSLFATNANSQVAKVNLVKKSASVIQIIREIENQTDYLFVFDKNEIDLTRKVDISEGNRSVAEVLSDIFRDTDVVYAMEGSNIILMPKNVGLQQQKTVSGKITDFSGAPLPGVTVVVKGTTSGIITDVNGNYSLANVPGDAILVFSFVGMKTQEIPVAWKTSINVTMEEETIGIDEVVAIGYGTVKKSDLTGSVSSVSAKSLDNHPMNDFSLVLQGRAPGVSVTSTSGMPGQEAKIRVRGANSISGGNDPLYVVNGFVTSFNESFNEVNVEDIESVQILKDASATAIYGSRGANGVVLITTKKGNSAYPTITVSANTGISRITDRYDLLNAGEYAEFINEYYGSDVFSSDEISNFYNGGGTDWQDAIFQTGINQNYQVSASGGLGKMNYYVSGNYINEKGNLLNTSSEKYSFRANINSEFSKRLKISIDINGMNKNTKNSHLSTTGSKKNSVIWNSLIYSPTESIFNDDGTYNETDSYGSVNKNPYMYLKESLHKNYIQMYSLNSELTYKIMDDLKYKVLAGVKKTNSESRDFNNEYIDSTTGAFRSYSDNTYWQITNLLSYDKIINEHSLSLTGGIEMSASKTNSFSAGISDLGIESFGYYNLSVGTSSSVYSGYSEYSLLSYLGRANYNFKSKYFFTGTYRIDGSSKFRGDNKYGYFPSFALGWVASEEPFIKDLGLFDRLKIRGSWGITGNQAINPYATLSTLRSMSYNYYSENEYPGYGPSAPGNPNLKWEETEQFDIGLDISVLNNKISLSLDYFDKKTTDLLTKKVLPYYSGMGDDASITQNLGEIDNKGFEANITYVPVLRNDFSWDVNLNFSVIRNEVIDLGEQESITGSTYGSDGVLSTSPFIVMPGKPLGSFYGYKFLGLWKSSEAEEAAKYGNAPGDSRYEDVDGDYSIDASDYQIIGDANPDFSWGLNNHIRYKNFDFNILIQGVHGQDIYNLTYASAASVIGDSRSITIKEATNFWTTDNENTIWPNISSTSDANYMNSSKWIQDGTYIKLRNISVAYTLSKKYAKIGDLKFTLSGQNLLTLSDYNGYDPEASSTSTSDTDLGLDFGVYPSPKTVTVGVSLKF